MEHITASSYNVKFFFKMFFRNILYCIFCSLVMGVISHFISITIIKDLISASLTLLGIKYIYIDGMKSINSKFTLNEFEYEKLKIKLPRLLVAIAIVSFTFALITSSIALVLQVIVRFFVSSLLPGGEFELFNMKSVVPLVLRVIQNITYSILIIFILKTNIDRIFNNTKLILYKRIIVCLVIYVVLTLSISISNIIITGKIKDESIVGNGNLVVDFEKEEEKDPNYNGTVLTLLSTENFTVFNKELVYHAGHFTDAITEFYNLDFTDGRTLLTVDDVTIKDMSNVEILYSANNKLYFFYNVTDAGNAGLYSIDLENEEISRVLDHVKSYDYDGLLLSNVLYYTNYIDNKFTVNKFDFNDESEQTLLTFETDDVENLEYKLKQYKEDIITYHFNKNDNISTIYRNDTSICTIGAPINNFVLGNNEVHIFVDNHVYSVNLDSGEVVNQLETPFETKDIYWDYQYSPNIDAAYPLINVSMTSNYIFNYNDHTLQELNLKPTEDSTLFPESTASFYKFNDEHLLMVDEWKNIYIIKNDYSEVVTSVPSTEIAAVKIDMDGLVYLAKSGQNSLEILEIK